MNDEIRKDGTDISGGVNELCTHAVNGVVVNEGYLSGKFGNSIHSVAACVVPIGPLITGVDVAIEHHQVVRLSAGNRKDHSIVGGIGNRSTVGQLNASRNGGLGIEGHRGLKGFAFISGRIFEFEVNGFAVSTLAISRSNKPRAGLGVGFPKDGWETSLVRECHQLGGSGSLDGQSDEWTSAIGRGSP